MQARMSVLLASLLLAGLAGLAGCKGKAKKMGEYPYALNKLDKSWEVARKSFQSENPNLMYGRVLVKNLTDLVDSMKRTYTGANRDEVNAKLKELHRKFKADIDAMVDMRFGRTELMPDVTIDDLAQAIEKGYQEYQEFKKLVE